MGYSGDTVFVVRVILIKLCVIILAGLPRVDVPFAGVWLAVPAGVALGLGFLGTDTLSCAISDVSFSDVGRVLWCERQLVSFVGSGWSRGLPVIDPCSESDGGSV